MKHSIGESHISDTYSQVIFGHQKLGSESVTKHLYFTGLSTQRTDITIVRFGNPPCLCKNVSKLMKEREDLPYWRSTVVQNDNGEFRIVETKT